MTVQMSVTVFNARTGADRRQTFLPTVISGASYAEARSAASSKGVQTEGLSFKLRIPADAAIQGGRTYVSEATYKSLTDQDAAKHWTLRKGDYILTQAIEQTGALSQQELNALAASCCSDLICIAEYADNTLRGSDAVKHWRIGGV